MKTRSRKTKRLEYIVGDCPICIKDTIGYSVRGCVQMPVWGSIMNSIQYSVRDSVSNSISNFVCDSVYHSVWNNIRRIILIKMKDIKK
jgi:hypothetical protein